MNSKLQKLLIDALNELSDYLSNESCNDWEFPKDWTDQECKEFTELCFDADEIEKWNPTPSNFMIPDVIIRLIKSGKL